MSRVSAQAATAQAETSPAVAKNGLRQSCACGETTGLDGHCSACADEKRFGVQAQLVLGSPGDRFEQEADRVADRVLTGPIDSTLALGLSRPASVSPLLQRQSEEEEETLQTKPATGSQTSGIAPSNTRRAAKAVADGGRPLARDVRSYFEPRFGRNLSHIRLHTGAEAQSAARGINARAYTLGNHIAFAPGQYEPETNRGRHLLAHELTHSFQQNAGGTIRRTCPSDPALIPSGTMDDFEKKAAEALKHETYRKKLDSNSRFIARHIIDGARGSACPMYYIDKLLLMFNTPLASGDELAEENREETAKAEKKETERLSDPYMQELAGVEEAIADKSKPNFKWRRGEGGKLFQVDRSDPTHIVVRMKVRLRAKGKGTKKDVERTEIIEDAIEMASKARGYTLDIDFVKRGGNDVFTVGVDPSQWTNSGNWVGDPRTIAHEAHHLLGLEDRYNYIEAHADNEDMIFKDRLFWFREQMVRDFDPLASQSMMEDEHSAASMNDQDICALAGGDFDKCIDTRLADLPISEIESRAKPLKTSYIPQNAGMLERLRQAWDSKSQDERTADCDQQDPICGMAPEGIFGDPNVVGPDADKFPLTNPHKQPAGRSLKRTRKAK